MCEQGKEPAHFGQGGTPERYLYIGPFVIFIFFSLMPNSMQFLVVFKAKFDHDCPFFVVNSQLCALVKNEALG